jgi:hypothetical protein
MQRKISSLPRLLIILTDAEGTIFGIETDGEITPAGNRSLGHTDFAAKTGISRFEGAGIMGNDLGESRPYFTIYAGALMLNRDSLNIGTMQDAHPNGVNFISGYDNPVIMAGRDREYGMEDDITNFR